MNLAHVEVRIRGRSVRVPSVSINGIEIVATGQWLRTAAVRDEEVTAADMTSNQESFISQLKQSGLDVDIFTFAQKVPHVVPVHRYRTEWDNAAAIPITTYADWLEKRVQYDVRKNIRKAHRLGIVVRRVEFDDLFVERICRIYDESPTRQGIPFWHYRKDFSAVKRENGTYLERSEFLGAYYQDELVGFIKLVYIGSIAATLQVIGQKRHADKKPMSALIAKAIEVCEQKRVTHLVYGSYVYDGRHSSLTEFKRRHGFEQILVPRYYVPLSVKGRLALGLNLHHRIVQNIPLPVAARLRQLRHVWYRQVLAPGRQPECGQSGCSRD